MLTIFLGSLLAAQIIGTGGSDLNDGVAGETPSMNMGVPGPQGPPGPQGVAGPAGATGQSIVGPQGPAGRDGVDGQSITGPVGPQGPKGDPGQAGQSITGPQGAVGPAGPRGLQGDPGASVTGPQGPQGPIGLTGLTGASGAVGPSGPQGVVGPQGPAGASVVGPAGPQGSVGARGPAGFAESYYALNTTSQSLTSTTYLAQGLSITNTSAGVYSFQANIGMSIGLGVTVTCAFAIAGTAIVASERGLAAGLSTAELSLLHVAALQAGQTVDVRCKGASVLSTIGNRSLVAVKLSD